MTKISSMLHGLYNYPNFYRFLVEIEGQSKYHMNSIFPVLQSKLNLDYFPRIRYKNIVLQKRTWILEEESILSLSNDFKERLENWIKDYNIPRVVELHIDDSPLVINLDNKYCINYLFRELVKNKKVIITELDYGFDKINLKDHEYFKKEITFSIINPAFSTTPFDFDTYTTTANISNTTYDEWIYFKIYLRTDYQNSFLYNSFLKIVIHLLNEGYISKFFYIRYLDPHPHLRLRFECNQLKMGEVYNKVKEFLAPFINNKVISNVTTNLYEPEISRYGGLELQNVIHHVFQKDSINAIKLIELMEINTIDINCIFFHSISALITPFTINEEEKIYLLNKYVEAYREGRSKNRRIDSNPYDYHIDENVKLAINIIVEEIINAYESVRSAFDNSHLQLENKEEIVFSLIHMHINRIREQINRDEEIKNVENVIVQIKRNYNLEVLSD